MKISPEAVIEVKLPSTAELFNWQPQPNLKIGTLVRKKDLLGQISFKKAQQAPSKIFASATGKITFIEPVFDFKLEELSENLHNEIQNKILCRIEKCLHKIVYNGICSECFEACPNHQSFKIAEKIDNVSIHQSYVEESLEKIRQRKKLVLLLDIDNTILHSLATSFKRIEEFFLDASKSESDFLVLSVSQTDAFLVKIRPFLLEFLDKISRNFEVIVYTFGSRKYAAAVLGLADPDQRFLKVG